MKKLLLLFFLILASCSSKRSLNHHSNNESANSDVRVEKIYDTVYSDRVVEKTKPIFSEIVLSEICTPGGDLIPVNYTIGSGSNVSHVFSEDGKLFIQQQIDSVSNIHEQEYQARWTQDSLDLRRELLKESNQVSETIRYVYPWWIYLLGAGLIIFAALWIRSKLMVL